MMVFVSACFVTAQVKGDSTLRKAPAELTAEKVVNNYIEAIGGKENLLKVKDRTTVMAGTVMGKAIKMTIYQKQPDKMRQIIDAGTFKQNIYFDGKKGIMEAAGKKFDVKGKELEKLKFESSLYLLPELGSLGIKLKLEGVANVNGKDAYKIDMILPSGTTWVQYYDPETWLKVEESKEINTPQGTFAQNTFFSNYREVSGVKYPFTVNQTMGKQKMEFTVTLISVNDGLSDRLFSMN